MRLNLNVKKVINIIIAALLITTTVISIVMNIKLNANNIEQQNTIYKLSEDNNNLKQSIDQMNLANDKLQQANSMLENEIQNMSNAMQELEAELQSMYDVLSSRRDFKSYMSYKAITDWTSPQWELQKKATTNEDGIRCIDGIPLVAVGTGWGLDVGDVGLVTCLNGNSFKIMVGDIKSDRHTDAERKTTVANGCRCEFIVDTPKISSTARVMGSMAVLSKYSGYVINIEKIN